METFYDADRHGSHAYLYGQEPGMACLAYQACALAYMGQPAEGQQKLRAALAIAEKANHPFSLAFSWTFAAWFYSVCGHARRTQSSAQIAIAVSTKYGFPFWRAMATNFLGGALTEQGRPLESAGAPRRARKHRPSSARRGRPGSRNCPVGRVGHAPNNPKWGTETAPGPGALHHRLRKLLQHCRFNIGYGPKDHSVPFPVHNVVSIPGES